MICVASNGVQARYGPAFSPYNYFAPWNVNDIGQPVPQPGATWDNSELSLTLQGIFEHHRFIEFLCDYFVFPIGVDGGQKLIARPHQYFAVSKAITKTVEAMPNAT
jgi:type I restriction enzyme R subunit